MDLIIYPEYLRKGVKTETLGISVIYDPENTDGPDECKGRSPLI